jgi:diaminopimelate epimerase
MKFTKMHGLGNDFVVVDAQYDVLDENACSSVAAAACDRHFGIGADGLILVLPSERADFRMQIFNADGSEADLCGNGIRCFAKYVYDRRMTARSEITVETARGICPLRVAVREGLVESVRVDMGEPLFVRRDIPINGPGDAEALHEQLEVAGARFEATCLAVGNPNCVIFVDDVESFPVERIGPQLERHPSFPRRTNVEFVEVRTAGKLRMRVWERGVGPTLACGSGACASLAAAARTGRTGRRANVQLDGGDLLIEWESDNHLYMTGPATTVFSGDYSHSAAPHSSLVLA